MTLLLFYDILPKSKPDLPKIRPKLFWDTNIESIDWEKQKESIIKRVLEKGTEFEKDEILKFYGLREV